MKHDRIQSLMLMVLAVLLIFAGCVQADDEPETEEDAFAALIAELKEEGEIPDTEGNYYRMGDFEDSFANIGFFRGIPLLESDHFVLSADLSWTSGSTIPNSATSGCGFFFNMGDENNNHLKVSLRMDGRIYLDGAKDYSPLSYWNNYLASPSMEGRGSLMLLVNGDRAVVFLNGERYREQDNLPTWGSAAGLAILSGTNQDFGTRCRFGSISLYTWE